MPRKKSSEPKAGRPHMPGYGIVGPKKGRLLPWRWATERLRKAHNYWISTCRPDGRPHTMPVWGVWLDGAFYFSTGRESRKAHNLAANPRCVVCPEGASEAVILEGVAREVTDDEQIRRIAKVYGAKYPFALDPSLGPIFAVRPRVAFGQIEKADLFTKTATRWRFN
ncbi:MAG: pyridoxamine 5'-phosphate oxidase family protein [Gammaproteobacteria bacterium]